MNEDKDAYISELLSAIGDLTEEVTALRMGWNECSREKKELERKLAEHELFSEFTMAAYGTACGSEHESMLNKIISRAKEEGGKEVVPEGWQIVPSEPTDEMLKEGASMFEATLHSAADFKHHAYHVFTAMTGSAPNP